MDGKIGAVSDVIHTLLDTGLVVFSVPRNWYRSRDIGASRSGAVVKWVNDENKEDRAYRTCSMYIVMASGSACLVSLAEVATTDMPRAVPSLHFMSSLNHSGDPFFIKAASA